MRILMVTMFSFNEALKVSWQDYPVFTLAGGGHKVIAYAYRDERHPLHSIRVEERDGVKVRRFQPPKKFISLELRKALREDGPFDLIHLHHLRNLFSYEVTRYAIHKNIPLIFTLHGLLHDPYLVGDRNFPFSGPILENNIILTKAELFKKIFTRGPLPKHFKNYAQHFSLKKARVLIAISHHEKEVLSRITGRTDIEIIPHWVDRDIIDKVDKNFFKIEFTRPVILFVGQLKYRRGFDLAIKILNRVKKENPLTTLIIITNNTDRKAELLNLAHREGVAENIILKENISEEEKFSLYKQADLYLSPTRYEGFGVTFLEAMACGCPVVASSIPVVNEIIEDGKTGLLARLEDPFDFAKKIKWILKDSNLRGNIIKNGLEKVEKEYNKEKIFGRLVNLYEKLTKSSPLWGEGGAAMQHQQLGVASFKGGAERG